MARVRETAPVSYVLTCPNCGPREVTDFSFGGEVNPRPRSAPSARELGAYNYFRDNVAGVQREWWFHRSGCGEWFLAERDTRTNDVLLTELPEREAVTRSRHATGERIDRERELSFTFDGKPVDGLEGDTIGSALFAAGRRTFSRSFKYHRRRGLMCCAGQCPNCLVQVDGGPGVRACTEPLREGMRVEHMNASPSLDFDVMRATDLFGGPFTPPGFYYKTFIRPRRLWPLYEKVLRHAAGLGRIAQGPARARVADRVPAPPRRRAGGGRRRGRPGRRDRRGGAGRRRRALRRGAGARRPAARRGRARARARAGRAGRARRGGGAVGRARARRLRRPGAGLAGRHPAPGARRGASSTPPARSSSRCCSPATTCPA